jgi:hypothetical protein
MPLPDVPDVEPDAELPDVPVVAVDPAEPMLPEPVVALVRTNPPMLLPPVVPLAPPVVAVLPAVAPVPDVLAEDPLLFCRHPVTVMVFPEPPAFDEVCAPLVAVLCADTVPKDAATIANVAAVQTFAFMCVSLRASQVQSLVPYLWNAPSGNLDASAGRTSDSTSLERAVAFQ